MKQRNLLDCNLKATSRASVGVCSNIFTRDCGNNPVFDPHYLYHMLISSNQLAGTGSLCMPIHTTVGVIPHNSKVFDFWNTKLISKALKINFGDFTRLRTPLDLRLLGTGILFARVFIICSVCSIKVTVAKKKPKN